MTTAGRRPPRWRRTPRRARDGAGSAAGSVRPAEPASPRSTEREAASANLRWSPWWIRSGRQRTRKTPATTKVSSTHGRFTSTCRSRWPIRLNRTTSRVSPQRIGFRRPACRSHPDRAHRRHLSIVAADPEPSVGACRRTARCQASLRTRRQAAPARASAVQARNTSETCAGGERVGAVVQAEHRLAGNARQVRADVVLPGARQQRNQTRQDHERGYQHRDAARDRAQQGPQSGADDARPGPGRARHRADCAATPPSEIVSAACGAGDDAAADQEGDERADRTQ